jgi:hypothetical protein
VQPAVNHSKTASANAIRVMCHPFAIIVPSFRFPVKLPNSLP